MSNDNSIYLPNSYIPKNPKCTIALDYEIINPATDEKVTLVTYKPENFVTPYSHKYQGTIRAIEEVSLLKHSGQEVIFYFCNEGSRLINVYARGIIQSITYGTIIQETTYYRGSYPYVESITFENGTNEGRTVHFGKDYYQFARMKYGLVIKK